MSRSLPAPHRDVVLLVARVVLGVVLFAHGWEKLLIDGIARTSDQFDAFGIPLAIVSAAFVTVVEFVGGALLVVGALTPLVVGLHLVVMIGAAGFVHLSQGFGPENRGLELVTVIAACELVLAAAGAGRYSVDDHLERLRGRRLGAAVADAASAPRTDRLPAQRAERPRPAPESRPAPRPEPDARPALFAPSGPQSRVEPRSAQAHRTDPVAPRPRPSAEEPHRLPSDR